MAPTATRRNFTSTAQPTTLSSTINGTANSLQVPNMPGTWPAVPFEAALERGTINEEALLVTAVTGTGPYTWTVTRGYAGTASGGIGHNGGVPVEHSVTHVDYDEANNHASDGSVSHAHGPVMAGDIDPSAAAAFGTASSTEVLIYMGAM